MKHSVYSPGSQPTLAHGYLCALNRETKQFSTPPTRHWLLFFALIVSTPIYAQSTASIEGQVTDQHDAIVPATEITAFNRETGIKRTAVTDDVGRYQIAALPVGDYRIDVRARGFQTQIIEGSRIEVGRRITQNFQLQPGDISQIVTVRADHDL